MAYASLNGATIVRGSVEIPSWGNWHADLYLDRAPPIASPATLKVADMEAVCTVVRSVDWTGQRGVRIVGGHGGWRRPVPAKQYASPTGLTVSAIVSNTAALVGETATVQNDRVIGNAYTRPADYAGFVLSSFALGAWYIGLDGVTVLGERAGGQVLKEFTATLVNQPANIVVVATENIAEWLPGKTYTSAQVQGTIQRVRHRIDGMRLRTEVVNA